MKIKDIAVPVLGFVLTSLVALEVWQTKQINDLVSTAMLHTQEIEQINHAVNNVGADEKTLRELVVKTQKDIEFIRGYLTRTYNRQR